MQTVVCDQCGRTIGYPCLVDVSLKARYNIGHSTNIIGFVEVNVAGDFCNMTCLGSYAWIKALKQNGSVSRTDQDIRTPRILYGGVGG